MALYIPGECSTPHRHAEEGEEEEEGRQGEEVEEQQEEEDEEEEQGGGEGGGGGRGGGDATSVECLFSMTPLPGFSRRSSAWCCRSMRGPPAKSWREGR